MPKSCLVYDIETATHGASFQELNKHKLRFFGAYSYLDEKHYLFNHNEKDKIKQLINRHKFVVGFNNKHYDNIILAQEGIGFRYNVVIDLFCIIEQRQTSIKWKNSVLTYHLKSLSLDTITRTLELVDENTAKGDIDYSMLNKTKFTSDEMRDIEHYTLRDIGITRRLWVWAFNWFDSWGHALSKKDQENLVHISCSPSVYSYKVICKKAGLRERYGNAKIQNRFTEGGYVAYPAIESVEGNVYCMDFASLYPHIMIQCNMFGRQATLGWQGYNCNGRYNDKEMHKISKALHEMYLERRALKKAKDPREYGLKIAMNTIYGLLRSSLFASVYDDIAGNDVCLIGQHWIKLARQKFRDAGYFVFYTDTDSVYIEDKENNKEKLLKVTKEIIAEIKTNVPFPVDSFDMDIDYEIDFISFFKGGTKNENEKDLDEEDTKNKELGLLKKNYIFSYKKGDVHDIYIKNLGIVKRSNTDLSRKIFWEKMKPLILEHHSCKFPNAFIEGWIKEYIDSDIKLFTRRFTVKDRRAYKVEGCMQVQIHDYIPEGQTNPLGPGTYFLVPNKKMGVGKGMKKYCTLEEYKNHLTYDDLFLDVAMKELSYFNENYTPPIKTKKVKGSSYLDSLIQQGLW